MRIALEWVKRGIAFMIRLQRTIKNTVSCEGIGLHTAKPVKIVLKPAPIDTGVVFVRTDLDGAEIAASTANIAATSYATTLSQNGAIVKTVEHLLAAFAGLNIDNVIIEIDSEEVPIMDGSARPFIRLLSDACIQTQGKFQRVLKVIKPITVREGDKQIAIWPSESPAISYFIDFSHPMLKEQSLQYLPSEMAFLREVVDARTFGFLSDVQNLQANGLAKGGSMDNAVVLGDETVLNKEGLRYKDEFVRHKILDLIGDFLLVGMPIIGHIVAHKSGHALNAQMVSKLTNSPQHWVLVGSPKRVPVKQQEMQYQHTAL
jgi:UDP-3-O-[3-hydroxymyristoyl] N-acetylglucosamine deacetylase